MTRRRIRLLPAGHPPIQEGNDVRLDHEGMFLMFSLLAVLLRAGLPLSFVTGGLACIFVFGDAALLNLLPSHIFPLMTGYQLSAIPLFIFMA